MTYLQKQRPKDHYFPRQKFQEHLQKQCLHHNLPPDLPWIYIGNQNWWDQKEKELM